jgi:hypothetical protein
VIPVALLIADSIVPPPFLCGYIDIILLRKTNNTLPAKKNKPIFFGGLLQIIFKNNRKIKNNS